MTTPIVDLSSRMPQQQPQQTQLIVCDRCGSVRAGIPAVFEGVISPQLKPCPVCFHAHVEPVAAPDEAQPA